MLSRASRHSAAPRGPDRRGALAAGAWEMHRLDQSVQDLQADVEGGAGTSLRLDRTLSSLATLSRQAAKQRESVLRQEFQLPIYSYLTQVVVAVETGNLACTTAKRRWERYVNDELVPFLNKPKQHGMKLAVQHDDPDYHATLLNAFSVGC
jgi:hypothetical protein